jgi:hypothetical protein
MLFFLLGVYQNFKDKHETDKAEQLMEISC